MKPALVARLDRIPDLQPSGHRLASSQLVPSPPNRRPNVSQPRRMGRNWLTETPWIRRGGVTGAWQPATAGTYSTMTVPVIWGWNSQKYS